MKQVVITFTPANYNNDPLGQRGFLRIAEFQDEAVISVWHGNTMARTTLELLSGTYPPTNVTLVENIDLRKPTRGGGEAA
jgi:hypothetical protein